MKRISRCLLAVIFLAGCTNQAPPPVEASPATQAALSKDDQVRLAVFRHLLTVYQGIYEKPDSSRLNAFYLSVGSAGTDKDPSDLLAISEGRYHRAPMPGQGNP